MQKRYNKSLFIFRRDLRLSDNTALLEANRLSSQVTPCFIFDPRQVTKNPYKSQNALEFMVESLKLLEKDIKQRDGRLLYFYGDTGEIVKRLLRDHDALFINADYTPFSRGRDKALKDLCKKAGCDFHCMGDTLLNAPGTVLKKDGKPYTIYTPFYKVASVFPVSKPKRLSKLKLSKATTGFEDTAIINKLIAESNPTLFVQGGRSAGLKLLSKIKRLSEYDTERNIPELEATTKLSTHNKFGTLSIREVYHTIVKQLGADHALIRQLYWRDFFTHIAYHFPHVFSGCFHKKFDGLKWDNNRKYFNAWCKGKTGFPIVDAGMRQLNTTGNMHNRVRMIVASFLVKDLHINWQWGEKYFATQLVDYDPAVNNGSWQWAASTGCDAQPYFRIFNPWLQQKKFDPECRYIKAWIPELKTLAIADIHNREEAESSANGYPAPIVDHHLQKEWAEEMFADLGK
ncbi:DNA photolyase family protein [Oligoflexia bacterium]|nr:DNA photolyase family protein [Oligoflexia bacterium]